MNAILNTSIRNFNLARSGKLWPSFLAWRARKVDETVARVFAWALTKQAVQEVVVDAFTKHQTPMCQALDQAITSHFEDVRNTIGADNIQGLDRYIEDGIESAMRDGIDADSINGLDREIENAVEEALTGDSDFRKEIVEGVFEELKSRLR